MINRNKDVMITKQCIRCTREWRVLEYEASWKHRCYPCFLIEARGGFNCFEHVPLSKKEKEEIEHDNNTKNKCMIVDDE